MKAPALFPSLLVATSFVTIFAKNLTTRDDAILCKDPMDFLGDQECVDWTEELLIPDYWLTKANELEVELEYNNYEKIICAPDDKFSICAFMEHGVGPVALLPQIKSLMQMLADECWYARCGQIDISLVDGGNTGVLKIAGVEQMGNCRGICTEETCCPEE